MTDLVTLGFRADTRGLTNAQRELDKTTAAGGRLDTQSSKTSRALGLVGSAIAALGVTASARQIVRYADSWSNLNSQLRQVTDSEAELIAVRERLLHVSKDTRTDLEGTVGLYTVLDRATSKLGVSTQEQIDITRTMNNMFLASGKTAQETSGAIRQLSQGLESGALRGDEFNSVAENAPRLLDAIASSTGMARGELREFAATGGITAEILVKALKEYSDEAQAAADLTTMTFGQSLEVASTNLTEFAGNSEFVTSSVASLSEMVVSLSEALVNNAPYVEAYFERFAVYGEDIAHTAEQINQAFISVVNGSAETFPILAQNTDNVFEQILDGFRNLPDNIRAFIKILTVELAYLVDLGMAYGQSFAEVLGVQFGALIDKAEIWGKQLLNNLNPFDDAISFEEDLAQIEAITSDMTARIIGKAVERADIARKARLDTIGDVLKERDQSVKAYQAIAASIGKSTKEVVDLNKAQKNQVKITRDVNKELDELMKGDLFSFGKSAEEAEDLSSQVDKLTSQVDDFGGTWSRTGNIIADSLGGAVSQLQDFASRMDDISSKQKDLNKLRGEYADGTEEAIKIDKALAKLDEESANAKISALGQTIGLSAQLFEENSKERKALHALEMGFMAAEIALAAEKAVTSAVSAVANQGSGDPYTAFGRIAAMIGIMTGVLGAAGIAFSGGSSGGGGGAAPQPGGTGTVLGDSSAQSASIANALDDFDDIQIDQLAELRGIRTALTGLSGGIQRLASQFATGLDFTEGGYGGDLGTTQNASGLVNLADKLGLSDVLGVFGDSIVGAVLGGLFGSTKKKLIDSGIQFLSQTLGEILDSGDLDAELFQTIETTKKKFFGLSKSSSTSTETSAIDAAITQQMADIFGFIGDSVIGAAESLGFDSVQIEETRITGVAEQVFGRIGELMGPVFETELVTVEKDLREALAGFEVDIGDISFKDKTGEEIQAELEAIFSQQADLIAEFLVPSISDYQKVGEGAFETLQRVAYEQAIFNDAMNNLGIEFTELSNVMKIDVAQSIIGLIGSAEEFSELTSSFFENFYSEAEQLSTLESSISDVFESLGLSMVNSKDAFRELVEGVDVTTEEGQQLLATLLELSPAMAEYLDQLDDLANQKLSLQIRLLEAQGKSEEALALSRQMELDAADESLHALMRQIWALEDAAKAERERTEAIEEMRRTLESNVAFAEQQLEKARQAEVARLEATITKAEEAYNLELEAINKQREAYNQFISGLQSNLAESESALQQSLSNEMSMYDDLISAAQNSANEQISAANEIANARKRSLNEELSIVSSVARQFGEASKAVTASEALSAARSGNFELASRIQTGGDYTSATEARIGAAREAFALAEIGKLADAQMSDLERSIAATDRSAERQIAAINAQTAEEVRLLEEQKQAVLDQVNAVLGIDDSVLSLEEAIAQYEQAQKELDEAMNDGTLEELSKQEEIAQKAYDQAVLSAEQQIEALNTQVDELLNLNESVGSVEEAIKLLLQERQALSEFEAANAEEQAQMQISAQNETTDAVKEVVNAVGEMKDELYDIIQTPPTKPVFDEPVNLRPDAGDDRAWPPIVMEPFMREIRGLRKDLDNSNAQIAANTAKSSQSLRKLEYLQSGQ